MKRYIYVSLVATFLLLYYFCIDPLFHIYLPTPPHFGLTGFAVDCQRPRNSSTSYHVVHLYRHVQSCVPLRK